MVATPDAYPQLMILIGPATALLFAAGFLWAWTLDRKRSYLLLFAAAYATFATGMGLQVLARPGDIGIGVPASALMNAAAALALATGLLRRSGRRPQPLPIIAIVLASAGGILWFTYFDDQLAARLICVNAGVAVMFAYALVQLADLRRGRRVDQVVFWIVVVFVLHFVPRALLLLDLDEGAGLVPFLGTNAWLGLRLSTAVSGAALALVLLIAAMIDLQDELRHERDTDRLTGLFNRRGFEERALPLLTVEQDRPLSLIVCDIDRFKAINDRFGHQAGDRVLAGIGAILRQVLRRRDVAARVGGEEFVLLLPDCDAEGARLIAERVRLALTQADFDGVPGLDQVTASFGIAELRPGESLGVLFARGDRLLYAAKRDGRNRILVDGEAG